MKKNIRIYTLLAIFNIGFLVISGLWGGVLSSILAAVAYIVPFCFGVQLSYRDKIKREEEAGVIEEALPLFKFGTDLFVLAPLLFPICALLFAIAYLAALVLGLFGIAPSIVPQGSVFELFVTSVLLPVLVEEAIFRYLPYKLLAPYSYRAAILLSSLFFAIAHLDFFKIPYALVAGIVFMALNITFKSMLPSIILHFSNNMLAVIWIKCYICGYGKYFAVALLTFTLISFIFIVVFYKRYISYAKKAINIFRCITTN